MGPATSKPCYLPHDYLCCRQFLAVPSLCWDAFCLPPSVCPAVRQPRIATGSRAAPRGIAQSDAWLAQAPHPGRKDGKWAFITLLEPGFTPHHCQLAGGCSEALFGLF